MAVDKELNDEPDEGVTAEDEIKVVELRPPPIHLQPEEPPKPELPPIGTPTAPEQLERVENERAQTSDGRPPELADAVEAGVQKKVPFFGPEADDERADADNREQPTPPSENAPPIPEREFGRLTQEDLDELRRPVQTAPFVDTGGDPLDGIDIAKRRGNYLLTVGRQGSGKSTLQSYLLRYLERGMEHTLYENLGDETEHDLEMRVRQKLTEWQEDWKYDLLPRRTEMRQPIEFRFHSRPINGRDKDLLEFSFFEIAGEDLKIDYSDDARGKLYPSLRTFLANRNCRFQFLFIVNGQDAHADDEFFSNFLAYLRRSVSERFWKESAICLVFSYPKAAFLNLKGELKKRNEPPLSVTSFHTKEAQYKFIKTFLPQTFARLTEWEKEPGRAPFHIGDIDFDFKHPTDPDRKRVRKWEPEDTRWLYWWIYTNFMGRPPDPKSQTTFFQRFRRAAEKYMKS